MGNVEVAYVKIDVFVPDTIFRRSICVKTKERVGFFMNLTHKFVS